MTWKVLVVDDNERWRRTLPTLLGTDERFEVVGTAADGASAAVAVAELGPDCVLLDISMPGVDGIDAIPLLRGVDPDVCIVVFTATGSSRLTEATDLGVDGYCFKGCAPLELLDTIAAALAGP